MTSNAKKHHQRNLSSGISKITITPQPETPINTENELTRHTKVVVEGENGESSKEFDVSYDELQQSDILGRGKFGTVRKAFHAPSGLTFAVKMIENKSDSKKKNDVMELVVPYRTGNKCPNLIKFYGALNAEACIWILTEVMDTSLDRFYVKVFALDKQMSELFISKVAYAIVNALNFMHELKIMHRDIKPSNVLLNSTGEIKVCDFGISGFAENSVAKTINGSKLYMAPEKINPDGDGYTFRADVWSLGISLIEIATNEHPFKDSRSFLGLIRKVVEDDPPKLDSNKFSAEFCEYVDKCLVKDAKQRADFGVLLTEPFTKKYQDQPLDCEFIKEIVDKIKVDPLPDL